MVSTDTSGLEGTTESVTESDADRVPETAAPLAGCGRPVTPASSCNVYSPGASAVKPACNRAGCESLAEATADEVISRLTSRHRVKGGRPPRGDPTTSPS